MVKLTPNRLFYIYFVAATALMLAIVGFQYYKHGIVGTGLFLGWDSSGYVWLANEVLAKGPIYMANLWNFPQLYTQLLAFLGYLSSNVALVERILPLFFGAVLIFANSKISQRATGNVHIAGLAAILTTLSLNFLRLLSDLHRSLMAFSLSVVAFLLVSDYVSIKGEGMRPLLGRKYLFVILVFFLVAATQFETFFVLSLSVVLLGILMRDIRKMIMLVLACAIPTVPLVLLFPRFFFGYQESVEFVKREIVFNEFLPWVGGSWIMLGVLVAAVAYLAYRTIRRREAIFSTIFCWTVVIILLMALTVVGLVPLPFDFAFRALIIMPMPILFALIVFAFLSFPKENVLFLRVFSSVKEKALKFNVRLVSSMGLILILLASSAIVVATQADYFLTPYIQYSSYEKISMAREILAAYGLSKPVVVFCGEPGIWVNNLYRNYIYAEIGEHFAYYGKIENLLSFVPTPPQSPDPSIAEMERRWSAVYFRELLGNWTGLPPTMYSHETYIPNLEALVSHPIVIITPDFYSKEIPFYITPFYTRQEGIYVILPNSIILSNQTAYGPTVTVVRDGIPAKIRSEYLYADPYDPSLIILRVSGSSGYHSYGFMDYPLDWAFLRIEQGGSLSSPETDPYRLDGAKALESNDPAESTQGWEMIQPGTINIDSSSKKEGSASLRVDGVTDSWSNLGVRYNLTGTWDLVARPLLAVWAKANETRAFSITLHDSSGNTRTFWDIRAYGSSVIPQWKRFVVNLDNYTSQTSGFDLAKVDQIDFYVSAPPGQALTLFIDDLTIDSIPAVDGAIFKARVLETDAVVAYFSLRLNY